MKKLLIAFLAALLLTVSARGAQLPKEVERALPEGTEQILKQVDLENGDALNQGLSAISSQLREVLKTVVRHRVRGAAAVLAAVLVCGAAEGFVDGKGASGTVVSAVGAVTVTAATAGSLEDLIGLGGETIRQLSRFSTVLLPAMAAASAASGAPSASLAGRAAAMLVSDLLVKLIGEVLMPMVYLYIGVLTASACLSDRRLKVLAEGVKKCVTWVLTSSLLAFMAYLSVVRVVSGSADALSIRLTKAAISGVVPVVGGIIAEASETVLAGALMLRNALGVGGMIAVLAAVAYPFTQLGVQYLLYKLTAAFAALAGPGGTASLVSGLGGAFGLVLGMTGACALLLLVCVLSFMGVMSP